MLTSCGVRRLLHKTFSRLEMGQINTSHEAKDLSWGSTAESARESPQRAFLGSSSHLADVVLERLLSFSTSKGTGHCKLRCHPWRLLSAAVCHALALDLAFTIMIMNCILSPSYTCSICLANTQGQGEDFQVAAAVSPLASPSPLVRC